ncbi:MAG: S8 family serine peptidase [Myxococcota bacterium]|nr:S8 family serine peptidase [Myxococcota bacterium]
MTTIRDAIRTATADNKVTTEEWNTLVKPAADATVKEASADAREVLSLFTNSSFEVEDTAKKGMATYLNSRGYDASATRPRPAGASDEALFNQIKSSNISETDEAFLDLATRAGKSTATTTIAVLDSGFDTDHDALDTKLWTNPDEVAGDGIDNDQNGKVDDIHGWDFVSGDNNPNSTDSSGHATHTTGIATKGTDQVKSISIRAFSPLDAQKLSDAIDYAVGEGARVFNMSFKVSTPALVEAVSAAMARHPDVLFVKSAGNDGREIDSYQANAYLPKNTIDNMAVVSSADQDLTRADYSNVGLPWSTHGAIGSDVLASVPGDKFIRMSGTSMAAPQVAGLAARMLILDPSLKATELKGMIADTTDRAEEWGSLTQSGGLINENRAHQLAALTGLVRSGLTQDAAASQLGLSQDVAASLAPLVAKYLPTAA